jgi:hypothetical protein
MKQLSNLSKENYLLHGYTFGTRIFEFYDLLLP